MSIGNWELSLFKQGIVMDNIKQYNLYLQILKLNLHKVNERSKEFTCRRTVEKFHLEVEKKLLETLQASNPYKLSCQDKICKCRPVEFKRKELKQEVCLDSESEVETVIYDLKPTIVNGGGGGGGGEGGGGE